MSETQNFASDRRMHAQVREVFDEACALLAPMMGAVKQGYVSDFALTHIVHDNFPDLTSEEVEVLILAVRHYDAQEKSA